MPACYVCIKKLLATKRGSYWTMIMALLFSASAADAKKSNYPIEMLIGMADVIVTGQIVSVSGDTAYLFSIDEPIKGKTPRQIRVKLFRNWACDVRLKPAVAGQQLLLFLTKKDSTYNSINGSDGELFITNNKLQMYNVFNFYSSQYFDEAHSPQITEVVAAICSFLHCYSFSYTIGSLPVFQQLKTDEEITAQKNTGGFSLWLFARLAANPYNYKIIKDQQQTASQASLKKWAMAISKRHR